jgi:hypothetical protein
MEIKVKALEDTMTVRENGGFMEFTIKQEKDFCVMFVGKKDAKRIAEKLLKWAGKKDIKSTKPQLQQADVMGMLPLCKHDYMSMDANWRKCTECGDIKPNGNYP